MQHIICMLPLPAFSSSVLLPVAGTAAFLLTYIFTFGVIAFCRKVGWVEKPVEGKIHTRSLPRLGGVGIFASFLLVSLVFYMPSLGIDQPATEVIFGQRYSKELVIYVLFIIASALIVVVHVYDDVRGLKPLPKLVAQTVAVLILLGPDFHYFQGVLFWGIHNPFVRDTSSTLHDHALPWYRQSTLTLFIHDNSISLLSIPAVLFTWFWITGMMNAVNFIDGLDGLAAGITAITALFITIISWRLGQFSVALLSAIFTGAVVGFIPHNWHPAKIIMGDSGSQFLGITLAVLAVIGGAKFALILMLLGLPILDIAWVMLNRVRRGQHPMQRDILPLHSGSTHLHYRLLFGGLNAQQVCFVLYGVTFLFGLFALALPPIYKLIGFVLVGVVMASLLLWSRRLQTRRATRQAEIEIAQEKQA
ncbi:MAG: undecaprenyl/decaprenyl-phosphate alpha-N-acetylglucosaminyl 1-phosphate transferase [Chloroflexota bacterium]|nr:undecaprenyl/decaprenyl-phosphate alpha-N-acetylglucosaminyl 1-phosphate transferase [Chloroflexota bacterium]